MAGLVGRSAVTIRHVPHRPSDRGPDGVAKRRTGNGSEPYETDFRVVRPDGAARWSYRPWAGRERRHRAGSPDARGGGGRNRPVCGRGSAVGRAPGGRDAPGRRHPLAAEFDLGRLILAVTDETTALTGAGFGAFHYNPAIEAGNAFVLHAVAGAPGRPFDRLPHPGRRPCSSRPPGDWDGPAGRRSGRPLVREEPATPPDAGGAPAGPEPPGSAGLVPDRAGPWRAVLRSPGVRLFAPPARAAGRGVAAQEAVAIDNARLLDQARPARGRRASRSGPKAVAEPLRNESDSFLRGALGDAVVDPFASPTPRTPRPRPRGRGRSVPGPHRRRSPCRRRPPPARRARRGGRPGRPRPGP